MNEKIKNPADDGIALDELLWWLEFGCWVAIALFPFLYYVNGPSVSTDQAVFRGILTVMAIVGAISLRFWNWHLRRIQRNTEGPSEAQISQTANDHRREPSD